MRVFVSGVDRRASFRLRFRMRLKLFEPNRCGAVAGRKVRHAIMTMFTGHSPKRFFFGVCVHPFIHIMSMQCTINSCTDYCTQLIWPVSVGGGDCGPFGMGKVTIVDVFVSRRFYQHPKDANEIVYTFRENVG